MVPCNQCGAQIEIAASTNFVTCARCGAALVVRRTGSSTYTEPTLATEITTPNLAGRLESDIKKTPDPMSELQRLSELNRLENELTRLDLDWQQRREQFMLWGQYGHRQIPTRPMSLLSAVFALLGGGVWMWISFSMFSEVDGLGADFFLFVPFLFGLAFIGVGVGFSMYAYNKAIAYEEAELSYRNRRADLLLRISEVQR